MKRVAFKTVGCRLNQAETAQIASEFQAAGYAVTDWGKPCEVAVVHSCAVTAGAEQTSARLVRAALRQTPRPFTVLAGCAAEVAGARLQSITGADLVVSQRDKFDIPARMASLKRPALVARSSCSPGKASPPPLPPFFSTTRALVKIQDGCDFKCAYCIVPLARGKSVSRPSAEILDDIERLAERGTREIMLTGANIGCFRRSRMRLPDLLARVEMIAGIERIRIGSIEMSTAEKAVIDFMAQSAKLCRSLHFPLQSGDDGILKAMGRCYAARDYRQRIEYAAATLDTPGLGADIVVGFPGEDRRAFANTLALVRDLPFSNLHVFPFSPRPGTRAWSMGPSVPHAEKRARVARLIALGEKKKRLFARSWLYREVAVLIENTSPRYGKRGWTGEYLPAVVHDTRARANEIVRFVPNAIADGALTNAASKQLAISSALA